MTAIPKAGISATCQTCGSQSAAAACPKLFDGAEPPQLWEAVGLLGNTDYVIACLVIGGCDWQPEPEGAVL